MILPRRLTGIGRVICFLCLFLQSCGTMDLSVQELTPVAGEDICRIAVLPFTNRSDYRDGGVLFNRVFTAELCRMQEFQLVSEGDIMSIYRQVRLNPYLDRPSFDKLRIIGDYLNADAFIIGEIVEMGEKNFPFMTVSLEIIDARNGRPILKINHRRSGEDYLKVMHFGMVASMIELAGLLAEEIINNLIARGFTAKCSN